MWKGKRALESRSCAQQLLLYYGFAMCACYVMTRDTSLPFYLSLLPSFPHLYSTIFRKHSMEYISILHPSPPPHLQASTTLTAVTFSPEFTNTSLIGRPGFCAATANATRHPNDSAITKTALSPSSSTSWRMRLVTFATRPAEALHTPICCVRKEGGRDGRWEEDENVWSVFGTGSEGIWVVGLCMTVDW